MNPLQRMALRTAVCVFSTGLVAACGPATTTTAPPTSIGQNTNRELEPPNSLPRGFTTANPLAPDTGILGRTR